MKSILRYFLGFLAWNLPVGLLAFLPPQVLPVPLGLLLALALSGWVLHRFVLRAGRRGEARRRAVLRLRPLRGDALRWTLVAVPVLLVLSWAMGQVYTGLVPVPEAALNPLEQLLRTSAGRLALAMLAIGVAPVMEEFFFRGLMQRTAERRWGARAGIAASAALFGLVHGNSWMFPLYFMLGVMFGYAVYATRSIWSGVLLHAANNVVALVGATADPEPLPPTVWEVGPSLSWWGSVAMLAAAAAAAVWTARGLRQAGRAQRLRSAAEAG